MKKLLTFTSSPDVLVHAQNILGEGPIWDSAANSLLWVDIIPGKINQLEFGSLTRTEFSLNKMVGCVGLTNQNRWIAAVERSLGLFDPLTNRFETHLSVEENLPRNRFNDGKCAPDGSFIVGSMDMDEKSPSGALYKVESNSQARVLLSNRTISNGIAWSPDHRTIFTIDTPTMKVMAHDYEPQSGELLNSRLALTIPEGIGYPDGMTADLDGNLWIAMWGGSRVTVWNPRTGEMIGSLTVPCLNPTSCSFGGENFDTLFITSARAGMNPDQLNRFPHSGDLFVVKLNGIQGEPGFIFKE